MTKKSKGSLKGIFDHIEESQDVKLEMEEAYDYLRQRPGNRKESKSYLRDLLSKRGVDLNEDLVGEVLRKFNKDHYDHEREHRNEMSKIRQNSYRKRSKEMDQLEKDLERLKKGEVSSDYVKQRIDELEGSNGPKEYYRSKLPEPYEGDPDNVLIIGDTHEPFSIEGYLEFCREVQERFDCGTIVHIGDVIDNHYSSYHETDPDGFGAGCELDRAIARTRDWGYVFPEAKVCIGNHDRLVHRKAKSADLSKRWIRDFQEVLDVPGWDFQEGHEIHGILFEHGNGRSGVKAALNKAVQKRISTVQGHIHTEASVMYNQSPKDRLFGMQVGCGIDEESYALAYAKDFPKSFNISCGVILNRGELPIVVPMDIWSS